MKTKPIMVNLTQAEAECVKALLDNLLKNYHLDYAESKPVRPLVNRLLEKFTNVIPKKP